jgi:hypothetical protein
MDFRQYDNAIGRFGNIDLLAENSMEMTPYHFGNNNPNYWADPSGLYAEHLNSGMANTLSELFIGLSEYPQRYPTY